MLDAEDERQKKEKEKIKGASSSSSGSRGGGGLGISYALVRDKSKSKMIAKDDAQLDHYLRGPPPCPRPCLPNPNRNLNPNYPHHPRTDGWQYSNWL